MIPYFKAGLENGEFCVRVVSAPFSKKEAENALLQADPIFRRSLTNGSIEIIPAQQWYLKGNKVDAKRIIDGWQRKLRQALAKDYAGMRLSGNAFWLTTKYWQEFQDYELAVGGSLEGRPIVALCTYPLAESELADVLDVARAHQFAMARRNGAWQIIHSTDVRDDAISLTTRELEALALAAQGKSASQSAKILRITKRTVDEHIQTATRKLQAANRTQAVAIAIRDRIIAI